MDDTCLDAPLRLDRPETVRRIHEVLDRVGFGEQSIAKTLGAERAPALDIQPVQLLKQRRRLRRPGALEVLVRVFLLGDAVAPEVFERAIAPTTPAEWAEVGLVRLDPSRVEARVALLPHREGALASDAPWRSEAASSKCVLGISKSTMTLTQMTVRARSGRTLDLGSGNGIQAFQAASHSAHVVGVDNNPRAVNMAAFSTQLGGFDHVEFREGDWFGPVRGERFDLIVGNPPYIISPESSFLYRDGGARGDQLFQRIVREAPALLNEGGFAQFIGNWVHIRGEDWRARLAGWVEGSGCDAWVLRLKVQAPDDYATGWIESDTGADPPTREAMFARWMADYEAQAIEAISFGLITLRRAPGRPNWCCIEDAPALRGLCGDSILRGFALRDFLEAVRDDRALLAARLRLSPEMRLEQVLRPTEGSWGMVESFIHLPSGLAYRPRIDQPIYEMLHRSRGQATVGELLAQVAAKVGGDPEEIPPSTLEVVRSLVAQGFLLPAEPSLMS
jgi:hypothetical protein